MKLRHGKLLTNARERLVIDYWDRRNLHGFRRTRDGGLEYEAWVRGFERFMCRGLEQQEGGRVADPSHVVRGRAPQDGAASDENFNGKDDSAGLPQMARVD